MNVNCGLTSTDVLSILLCSANYELNYEDLYLALLSGEDRFLLKYQSNRPDDVSRVTLLTTEHADGVDIVSLPLLTGALHLDLRVQLSTALLAPVVALQSLLHTATLRLEVRPGLGAGLAGPLGTAGLLQALHTLQVLQTLGPLLTSQPTGLRTTACRISSYDETVLLKVISSLIHDTFFTAI